MRRPLTAVLSRLRHEPDARYERPPPAEELGTSPSGQGQGLSLQEPHCAPRESESTRPTITTVCGGRRMTPSVPPAASQSNEPRPGGEDSIETSMTLELSVTRLYSSCCPAKRPSLKPQGTSCLAGGLRSRR